MDHKIVDGITVPLTPEEAAEIAAFRAAAAAEAPRREALARIMALEAVVTPRRMREAMLSSDGKAWLAEVDAQIATLRGRL